MRTRVLAGVASLAVAALGLSMIAHAGAATDRATGGGQILESTDQQGAGDTIAFVAHQTTDGEDAATGNVTYIDRTVTAGKGTGKGQTVLHGTVECLQVEVDTARLQGTFDGPDAEPFQLYVQDTGEGHDNADVVGFVETDDTTCSDPGDEVPDTALARGNAQVYDANPAP